MKFSEQLNKYMTMLDCSGKELSDISKIPAPIISEYKNGNREPKINSKQLNSLIDALFKLAKNKKIKLDIHTIKNDLETNLIKDNVDFEVFRHNFNLLITTLNIKISDLASFIGFDSSYISKIKSGHRKPLNITDFANGVCKYIINNYADSHNESLQKLINNVINFDNIYYWLTNNIHSNTNEYKIDSFLQKLDNFDLNDYIKAIKFDKLIVPTLPKVLFKTKNYYGFNGYKDSQLEVLKQIAFSKNKGDIFWFNNLPFDELSKDLKFTKKYMLYMAFILKKGFNLNIIHDLDRPFNELMLGLEGWIPLYMTGQINPYYFKNNSKLIYSHIECTSDSVILHGESLTGHIDTVKLLVSNKKEDIDFYKNNSKLLLKKANSLMNIYNSKDKDSFLKLINDNYKTNYSRRNVLVNLPIYTISDELLNKILNENNINDKDKITIKNFVKSTKKVINTYLKNSKILDEITILNENEFNNNKVILDLSDIFYEKDIIYSYENYQEHLKLVKDFSKNNNYKYKLTTNNIFKNINIRIIGDKQIIISKINAPITQFVIYHPKLVNAIKNFEVPIKEEN